MAQVDDAVSRVCDRSWLRRERILLAFEDALRAGHQPVIEEMMVECPDDRPMRIELVHLEMEHRLRAGETIEVAEYLRRFPSLAADDDDLRGLFEAVDRHRRPEPSHAAGMLGKYALLEPVGEGAFGVVYRARDTQLDRVVAVKVPRPGAWSDPAARARFAREARGIARLRHPGIVAVHDAGPVGDTFAIVSEFIDGQTLAQRLRRNRPSPREAAALIAQVAEAIDAAHREGVIHRDLKPANIMIDRDGRPRVVDFGLARLSAGDEASTADGQLIGTPVYMSPEQARGDVRALDARSDVYSLGAILYELLTGATPFQGTGPRLLAQVCEDDPPRPRRLNDAIPPDLETVCLKAMAKEPPRRYATAAALADDLTRFVRLEPVHARPIGPASRFWRRCRRNPVLASALATLAVVTVAGFLAVVWQWRRADRFRLNAETSLADAHRQHNRLLESLRSGQRVVLDLTRPNQARTYLPGDGTPRKREWVDLMLADYRALLDQLRVEPSLRPELAGAYAHVASVVREAGWREQAQTFWESALRVCESLTAEGQGDNPQILDIFGRSHWELGCFEAGLGRPGAAQPHKDQARAAWRRACDHLERRLSHLPDDTASRALLGNICLTLGSAGVADSSPPGAVRRIERSAECWEWLIRKSPGNLSYRSQAAACVLELGRGHRNGGRLAEALRDMTRARETWEHLSRDNGALPDGVAFPFADCCKEIGVVLRTMKRYDEALGALQQAERLWENLVRQAPSGRTARCGLASTSYLLGAVLDDQNQSTEALRRYGQSAELCEELMREAPWDVDLLGTLATCYHCIGRVRVELGQASAALEPLQRALAIKEPVARKRPSDADLHSNCGGSWHRLGEALAQLGRRDEAIAAYRRAIAYQAAALKIEPGSSLFRRYLKEQSEELARLEPGTPVVDASR